ncbi:MAG: hypothetical protein EOP05_13635 [Proteobacteria bacterium]|nr:MAG: hypothetical protein EOP05_13635 [Pseudomonadota bacterium]
MRGLRRLVLVPEPAPGSAPAPAPGSAPAPAPGSAPAPKIKFSPRSPRGSPRRRNATRSHGRKITAPPQSDRFNTTAIAPPTISRRCPSTFCRSLRRQRIRKVSVGSLFEDERWYSIR